MRYLIGCRIGPLNGMEIEFLLGCPGFECREDGGLVRVKCLMLKICATP